MRSLLIGLTLYCIYINAVAAVPHLVMPSDDGREAVTLTAVDVRVTIRGHLARTEYDLTFRNNLDRIVGGDFIFPLPPDGEVSDLGLYFNGKLRHGVAVERVIGKTAYEQTVHRRVDPALAEWTDSGAFRMRLYPIPVLGEKRVHIACDQELLTNDYMLDLRFKQKVSAFNLVIDADGRAVESERITWKGSGSVWNARESNFFLDGTVSVARSDSEVALAAWSDRDRKWYLSAPLRTPASQRAFDPAANVIVLWDASGSSVQQDAAKLREFLHAFVGRQRAWASVTLVPFHAWTEEPREVLPASLARTLDNLIPAGATNLTAALERIPDLASHTVSARIVLVTDGLSSMEESQRLGKVASSLASIRRPLTVVNASPRANAQLLNMLAASTGGIYLDLTRTSSADAVERAMRRPARIDLSSTSVGDVIPRLTAAGNPIAIAASTANHPASFALTLRDGNSVTKRELPIRDISACAGLVVRAWARQRLRELTDSGSDAEEITELGTNFTMLTPQTSLIVLESWRDYDMYGIALPDDLAEEKRLVTMERPATRQDVVYSGPVGWFIKGAVADKSGAPLPGTTVSLVVGDSTISTSVSDANGHFWLPAATAPQSFSVRAELSGFGSTFRTFTQTPSGGSIDLVLSATVSEAITVTASAPGFDDSSNVEVTVSLASVKGPQHMQLDEPLARWAAEIETASLERRHEIADNVISQMARLRSLSDRLRLYAAARSFLGGEKSFHVAAAELLRDDDNDLAVRVLTDLAEAYADDAPIVRIVARIADGWGRADVARGLLLHALDASPKEPQTWRELILLATRNGRAGDVEGLVKRHRAMAEDVRMGEVDQQIGLELARGRSGDLRLDPSADVQVELMFDSNYSYVDIHVAEPSSEEVTWNHDRSQHGGIISGWLTEGYGPEIYVNRGGLPGEYRVYVQYYSSDRSEVSAETMAHLIVYSRGRFGALKRNDYALVLSRDNERRLVTTVRLQ